MIVDNIFRESSIDRLALIEHVEELSEKQFSQRESATELGISAATVNRCLKAENEAEITVSL